MASRSRPADTPPASIDRARPGRPWRDERGAANTAAMVVLFPVWMVATLGGTQAVLWQHARQRARAAAQDAAALVARGESPAKDAERLVRSDLDGGSGLDNLQVQATIAAGRVTVAVHGTAPGIVTGTHVPVDAQASEPIEGFRSP